MKLRSFVVVSVLFFVLGLMLSPVESARGEALKPMSESEMSQVSGQAQATTIEKLATVVDRRQTLKQFDGRLGENEEGNLGDRIMTKQLDREQSIGSLATMPVQMMGAQVMQPQVLVDPEAQKILTHDAFQETMKIAGTFAKMFANP